MTLTPSWMPEPPRAKILLVDDRPQNLVAAQEILKELEADLLLATSGNDALALCLQHELALVLLDVEMPGMDGLEVASLMRTLERTRLVPIIFVTAADNDDKITCDGYEAGAVDFIRKPIVPEILRSKVQIFLQLHLQRVKLGASEAELLRSNRALQGFAHTAAHDFRAPIRHIVGFVDRIVERHGQGLEQSVSEMLDMVRKAAIRMDNLSTSMLEYAQLNGGAPHMAPTSLQAVLQDVVADLRSVLEDSGGTVSVGQLPCVQGNCVMMHQLFSNLIGNALKYRKPDSPPHVEIRCEPVPESQRTRVLVVDDGIGFKQEFAREIFEPFRRLVGSSDYEGSGIGMATAHKIVEVHGGAISATGEKGVGATFAIELPLADA